MNDPGPFEAILQAKARGRIKAALRPIAEKLEQLDQLRERKEIQEGTRKTAEVKPFGGRATASGVHYEEKIAAWLAVKMLAGAGSRPFPGLTGSDLISISMQALAPVDDVLVELAGDDDAELRISAKLRGKMISLTPGNAVLSETIRDFISRYRQWSPAQRERSRLILAVPSEAKLGALARVLEVHREEWGPGSDELTQFLARRRPKSPEGVAFGKFCHVTRIQWTAVTGAEPDEGGMRAFLSRVFVEEFDFSSAGRLEADATENLAHFVVEDPASADLCWGLLRNRFADANVRGLRITEGKLRDWLREKQIVLKANRSVQTSVEVLRRWSDRAVARLREFHSFRLGADPSNVLTLERATEVQAFVAAAKQGHLLFTGPPGIGKSGMLHGLSTALEGAPVVCLLAEELTERDKFHAASLPGLTLPLAEVLRDWPQGPGYLILDALDAVRETERREALVRLLDEVRRSAPDWKIVASVREFDLKCSRRLRELFPGIGTPGYQANDMAGVAHFVLGGLQDADLETLISQKPELRALVTNAQTIQGTDHLLRSPFYLSIALDLLLDPTVTPALLADWTAPGTLLRESWRRRVRSEDEPVLRRAVAAMVRNHSAMASIHELELGRDDLGAIERLRSDGLLAGPSGNDDSIRFGHHLILDYAVARLRVPIREADLLNFLEQHPSFAVFWRQSLIFALEELWERDPSRNPFWRLTFAMHDRAAIRIVSRVTPPSVAARRIRTWADLEPLWIATARRLDRNAPAIVTLEHVVAHLRRANPEGIRETRQTWIAFAVRLGEALADGDERVALALANLLDVLGRDPDEAEDVASVLSRNAAGRSVLAYYVAHPAKPRSDFLGKVAIETVCRTFRSAPELSVTSLQALLSEERLKHWPSDDLQRFASNLHYLGREAGDVVSDLCFVSFSRKPDPDETVEWGTRMIGISSRLSDRWDQIRHTLANYYCRTDVDDARWLSRFACATWNACLSHSQLAVTNFDMRTHCVNLYGDGTGFAGVSLYPDDERRILQRFREKIREWATNDDIARLCVVIDTLAKHNRTALLWNVLLEDGARSIDSLGQLLRPFAKSAFCLSERDYVSGSRSLFQALHAAGNGQEREELEHALMQLPKTLEAEPDESESDFDELCQSIVVSVLGLLQSENFVLPELRTQYDAMKASGLLRKSKVEPLPMLDSEPEWVSSRRVREEPPEYVSPKERELSRLHDQLAPFLVEGDAYDLAQVEAQWNLLLECEAALSDAQSSPSASRLWRRLVQAVANSVRHAKWPPHSERWILVRRILMGAAADPEDVRESNGNSAGDFPSWSSPAPRVDAAKSLPILVYKLRLADIEPELATTLETLASDPSRAVRLNLVGSLHCLHPSDPQLFWRLADHFVQHERFLPILESLVLMLDRIIQKDPDEVVPRLQRVANLPEVTSHPEHRIHHRLAHTFVFRYLRTGDPEARREVHALIESCHLPSTVAALEPAIQTCRSGGWFVPDPKYIDQTRRAWSMLEDLLRAVQAKRTVDPHDGHALHRLANSIATQIYFASGAFADKDPASSNERLRLTPTQRCQFWIEGRTVFQLFAEEWHPQTVDSIVQTMNHLMPCDPKETFGIGLRGVIQSCQKEGFHIDGMARSAALAFMKHAFADYPDLFWSRPDGSSSEAFELLLEVCDRFLSAACPETEALVFSFDQVWR